jgi:hypothetical protein
MFWLLACAALGGLIGWLLAGINNRDTTAGAITGIAYGGGIIAVPMLLSAGLHAVPDWADVLVTLAVLTLVFGGLTQFLLGGLFGDRHR